MAAPTTDRALTGRQSAASGREAEAEMLRAYRDRLLGEVHQIERELEKLAR